MTELDDERRLLPMLANLPADELAALLTEHVDAGVRRDELCRATGIHPRRMKVLLARYKREHR